MKDKERVDPRVLADELYEGCDGCTETEEKMWKDGFVRGYYTTHNADPSSTHHVPLKTTEEEIYGIIREYTSAPGAFGSEYVEGIDEAAKAILKLVEG